MCGLALEPNKKIQCLNKKQTKKKTKQCVMSMITHTHTQKHMRVHKYTQVCLLFTLPCFLKTPTHPGSKKALSQQSA